MHQYKTKGTCSTEISFEIKESRIYNVSFIDGCDGNLKAVSVLVEGMETKTLIFKLKGIRCGGRNTSCCDQLALAVEQFSAG